MQYLDSGFKSLGRGTFLVPLHLWNVEQRPRMHQCWHASHPNWDLTLKSQVLVALVGLQISAQHSLPALGRITVRVPKFDLRYCTLRCTFCFISNFQWLVTYKGFRKDCCCDFDISIWVDNQLPQNPDYNSMLPLKSAVSHISIRSLAYKSKIKTLTHYSLSWAYQRKRTASMSSGALADVQAPSLRLDCRMSSRRYWASFPSFILGAPNTPAKSTGRTHMTANRSSVGDLGKNPATNFVEFKQTLLYQGCSLSHRIWHQKASSQQLETLVPYFWDIDIICHIETLVSLSTECQKLLIHMHKFCTFVHCKLVSVTSLQSHNVLLLNLVTLWCKGNC